MRSLSDCSVILTPLLSAAERVTEIAPVTAKEARKDRDMAREYERRRRGQSEIGSRGPRAFSTGQPTGPGRTICTAHGCTADLGNIGLGCIGPVARDLSRWTAHWGPLLAIGGRPGDLRLHLRPAHRLEMGRGPARTPVPRLVAARGARSGLGLRQWCGQPVHPRGVRRRTLRGAAPLRSI